MRLAGVTCWFIRSMNQTAPGAGCSHSVREATGMASSAAQCSRPCRVAAYFQLAGQEVSPPEPVSSPRMRLHAPTELPASA